VHPHAGLLALAPDVLLALHWKVCPVEHKDGRGRRG
jgi:hypothetical protein